MGKGPEAGRSNKGGTIQDLLHVEGVLLWEKIKDIFSNPNTLRIGIASVQCHRRTQGESPRTLGREPCIEEKVLPILYLGDIAGKKYVSLPTVEMKGTRIRGFDQKKCEKEGSRKEKVENFAHHVADDLWPRTASEND